MRTARSQALREQAIVYGFYAFLIVLWIAGGSVRADALGQVFVRAYAWCVVLAMILLRPRVQFRRGRVVLFILGCAAAIPCLQLVPLPPMVWQALPGRAPLAAADALIGSHVWRPIAIVPGAAFNALSSLVVPLAVALLSMGMTREQRTALVTPIILFIVAAGAFALIQLSGGAPDNPFVNEVRGDATGPFANRNHLALLAAIGCLLAPPWAFLDRNQIPLRPILAVLIVLFLILIILSTGSRVGLVLILPSLALGVYLAQSSFRFQALRFNKRAAQICVGVVASLFALFVSVSFLSGRAMSISRAMMLNPAEDFRVLSFPTVWSSVKLYFPVGSGIGGFDQVFKIHEPLSLLDPQYFNHAHNDYIEVIMDSGAFGLALLSFLIVWYFVHAFQAWTSSTRRRTTLSRVGSVIILLIATASAFDYPIRTPIVMMIAVLAVVWLTDEVDVPDAEGALPRPSQHL